MKSNATTKPQIFWENLLNFITLDLLIFHHTIRNPLRTNGMCGYKIDNLPNIKSQAIKTKLPMKMYKLHIFCVAQMKNKSSFLSIIIEVSYKIKIFLYFTLFEKNLKHHKNNESNFVEKQTKNISVYCI